MNKTAIKNFAIWARNKLITDVSYRAGILDITDKEIKAPLPQSTKTMQFFDIGTAEPYSITGGAIRQRERLADAIEQKAKADGYTIAYQNMIEEVAYTWFNRLIAIRFMEVNDYMPAHIRVLSSDSGKMEPDIVTTPFDAELEFTSEEQQRVMQLKTDNQIDELFRMLFIKQCNALNAYLPALFEKTNDYSELLLNLSVIDQEGVVYHLIHDIDEADFNIEMGGQVEIIGWLYQYYNTEPKAAAFAQKEKIYKDQIPAVTQLFTPDWIVRYMVENSLGRLWVEGHPTHENLKSNWKYYLEEAEQEPEVQAQLAEIRKEYAGLNPEDIKLIDPCMGSGHILVYCFDVLMEIYEAAGYSQRDAARSILENNIYGLDIDDRAFQLSYFALMMKARQYNRRILSADTVCHVHSICESNEVNRNQLQYFGADLNSIEKNNALNQMQGLIAILHDAKEYGSILNVDNYDWDLLRRFVASESSEEQVSIDTIGLGITQEFLINLIDIGETLANKYYLVITNPPYMASSGMGGLLSRYLKDNYIDSKSDLFAVFIEKCQDMCYKNGIVAMITMQSWMFIGSYEKLRYKIMHQSSFISMLYLGIKAFEEIGNDIVQTTSFIMRKRLNLQYRGTYFKLLTHDREQKQRDFLQRNQECIFYNSQEEFLKILGYPIAFWVSNKVVDAFVNNKYLGDISEPKQGIATGDNERFLRLWYEVNMGSIGFRCHSIDEAVASKKKWFPYQKGGDYRKWYGNNSYVVLWENDGAEIKSFRDSRGKLRSRPQNTDYCFRTGLTWTWISTDHFGARLSDQGAVFDVSGSTLFSNENLYELLGFLCSKVADYLLKIINPTINFSNGVISKLPVILGASSQLLSKVERNVEISCEDWNERETSWDFKRHPLLEQNTKLLSEAVERWIKKKRLLFCEQKELEEEINQFYIDLFEFNNDLESAVMEKDIKIYIPTELEAIKSLISYGIGCIFGRYSLNKDGLIDAAESKVVENNSLFGIDKDGIIPITDEEYFEDDIIGQLSRWLKAAFGEEALEQNLDFIAKTLGNKGDTSREVIRNYFLNDFYKDHGTMYSVTGSGKRPIYWLFDSGKQNGFKCLIYLHRYTADLVGVIRVDYLHSMQRIYENETNRMQDIIEHSVNSREVGQASKRKEKIQKQIKECRDYDEMLGHLALSRIELDLDDGVKVNYEKLQTSSDGKKYGVLAKI